MQYASPGAQIDCCLLLPPCRHPVPRAALWVADLEEHAAITWACILHAQSIAARQHAHGCAATALEHGHALRNMPHRVTRTHAWPACAAMAGPPAECVRCSCCNPKQHTDTLSSISILASTHGGYPHPPPATCSTHTLSCCTAPYLAESHPESSRPPLAQAAKDCCRSCWGLNPIVSHCCYTPGRCWGTFQGRTWEGGSMHRRRDGDPPALHCRGHNTTTITPTLAWAMAASRGPLPTTTASSDAASGLQQPCGCNTRMRQGGATCLHAAAPCLLAAPRSSSCSAGPRQASRPAPAQHTPSRQAMNPGPSTPSLVPGGGAVMKAPMMA